MKSDKRRHRSKPSSETRSDSKTGSKRTEFEFERDLETIAEMYLKGMSQWQIKTALPDETGAKYTLSQGQISQDLKTIRQRWRESSLLSFNEKKEQELAKIDRLELEYWEAWERSKLPRKVTKKRIGDTSFSENQEITTAGNARFLEGVESCIDKRCKIFGIYAAEKVKIEDDDGEGRTFTRDQIVRRLKAIVNGSADQLSVDPSKN